MLPKKRSTRDTSAKLESVCNSPAKKASVPKAIKPAEIQSVTREWSESRRRRRHCTRSLITGRPMLPRKINTAMTTSVPTSCGGPLGASGEPEKRSKPALVKAATA